MSTPATETEATLERVIDKDLLGLDEVFCVTGSVDKENIGCSEGDMLGRR